MLKTVPTRQIEPTFIRRNVCRFPESIKETLYKAIVRHHLEYASGAWNPHLKNVINKLRKASRFVKKKKAATVETRNCHRPTRRPRMEIIKAKENKT